jgi:hypothetical protein
LEGSRNANEAPDRVYAARYLSVTTWIENPEPTDILPRETVFNRDASTLAVALLPWARRNPRFTFVCAMWASGLRPQDVAQRPDLVDKVRLALRVLGCRPDGMARPHAKIWFFPDRARPEPGVLTHVTRAGYSEDASIPPPQPFQVAVCKAWLQEHARKTATVRRIYSTDSLRRLVTEWTRVTGAYRNVEQVNEHTSERYFSEEVYVTNGAFLLAATEEGYLARRVGVTGDAWFNMIHRKTGAKWKGRKPKEPQAVVDVPSAEYNLARGRPIKVTDLIDENVVRARLVEFLQELKDVATSTGTAPRFRLKQALRAAGFLVKGGRPPEVLTRLLHQLGWESTYSSAKGERGHWWVPKYRPRPRSPATAPPGAK